jgi:8-oxo-dGTP diphosphatase
MKEPLPYCYAQPHPAATVDLVIFTLREDRLHLLLIERGTEPFRGEWALPGGFVRIEESLTDAARRELSERTGLSLTYLEQVGAFGEPQRDPRERVISVAFFAIISADKFALQAGSGARSVAWRPCIDLPPVAFDHREIIDAARVKLADEMNRSTIALEFLPAEFTLTELQRVFESVRGEAIDKRNFRKWAESLSFIKPTGKLRRGGQHRPAALYRADSKPLLPSHNLLPERAARASDSRRATSVSLAYQKGYEDALSAMRRSMIESEKMLLRAMLAR